jgi:hypothetical protein
MKKIRNFVYENRVMNVLKRHTPMIYKPAFAALVMLVIWHYMRINNLYLEHSDLALTISMGLWGVIYGVGAALTVTYNWEKYRDISSSVVRIDKDRFLEKRDEKMPVMLHIWLGTMALSIELFLMLIKYENVWVGRLIIFDSSFFLCLNGLIALELDNPIRSIWFQKSIPPDWMTENVKKYFEKKFSVNSSLAE